MAETSSHVSKRGSPPGNGEMARRVRQHDWAATALGPMDSWPQSLKTIVTTVLDSPLPMMVLWGDDLIQIYNDGYRTLLSERMPDGLGQPTMADWPELGSATAPIFEAVLRGDTRSLHDQQITISPWPAPEIGWFDFAFSPLREESGRISGILVTIIDTTLAVQASQGLRESEGRVGHIVHGARDYAIFSLDTDGMITDWPRGAETVFGWSAAEAVGRHFALTFPAQDAKQGAPDKELELARETGVAPDNRWHARKGGGLVFIEGVTQALRDNEKQLKGYIKIGQDVTARRQMQQQIRDNAEQLKTLIEGIPQLVWRAVGAGACTWVSPQWTARTGLSEEDSLGLGWLSAVHPEDRETVTAAWRKAEQNGGFDIDFRIVRADDGSFGWFQTRATALRDEKGRIVEWLGTSTDVDELRRLHEHEHVLLGELQHRVRNMLALIRNVSLRTSETSDTVEEMAMKLAGRLDAFARVQSAVTRNPGGGMELHTIVAEEFLASAVKEGDRLTLDGPPVSFSFRSAERMALAVHELATNALEHGALATPEGRIDIDWNIKEKEDGSWLVIDWKESGPETKQGPARKGFGLETISRSLPREMNANTDLRFEPDGIRCQIALPLRNLTVLDR